MWELDHTAFLSCTPNNGCFWTVVLKKTLESPLDSKDIKPVNPNGNQSWIFIWRTDTEVESLYFGHPMQRTDSLEKTLILGKTEGRRGWGWQRMRWWWAGKLGMLLSMGSQRVRHDWATELTERHIILKCNFKNSHSLLTNIVRQLQINSTINTLDLYGTQKYYKILLLYNLIEINIIIFLSGLGKVCLCSQVSA